MEFKFELNQSPGHCVSVNINIISTTDNEKIQNYFSKIHEITREFFFSETKQYVPVYLDDAGPNKILAIKTVRKYLVNGIKEAKDLVEAPKPVLLHPNMHKLEALKFVKELEDVGAKASGIPEKLRVMM